jgi:activator of HSP90 ATPase
MSQSKQPAIHQEIAIKASPKRVYDALTNAKQFSEMTGGAPAAINAAPGGAFSCFGGMIVGHNLELVPNQRLVQAWRAGNWEAGVFSIARFELQADGANTKLIFDHSSIPADQSENLEGGWHKMYWEPLQKYLS